ncbi:MAG: ABC transporter permease [Cryomorphaceae bacterium]
MKLKIYFSLLREGLYFAMNALAVNRLRTLLSLLGITIGIFAIISVFTLVDSMERSVRGSFAKLGDDTVFIERMPWGPESGDSEYAWWKYVQRPGVKKSEYDALRRRSATAGAVTFFSNGNRPVEYGSISVENVTAVAVTEGFENFITVDVAMGRSFNLLELEGRRPVCLLGYDVAARLFRTEDPIGKEIKIGGFKTVVIGTLKQEGQGLLGNGADEWAIMPVGFARNIINVDEGRTRIGLRPKEGVSFTAMEDEVIMLMRNVRGLRINQDNNFAVNKSSMLSAGLDELFGFLSIAGLIIGGFSILVGGFSIANIMFVSVRERTSIIGIQKALGAKRSFILFQFLFESVVLCLIGGVIGLLIIYLLTLAASGMSDFELILTWENIAMGIGFSAGIGVISGIVPAMQASKMAPVDAMRSTG